MSRTNKFPKTCAKCGVLVPANEGVLTAPAHAGGEWVVTHVVCPVAAPVEASATSEDFPPTAEQQDAIDLSKTGVDMVVVAGAGAGKTTLLRQIAKANPTKKMQYLAFGADIAKDVQGTMPSNVNATNVHKLAYAGICKGTPFAERAANKQGMSWSKFGQVLGVPSFKYTLDDEQHSLAASTVAGLVLKTIDQYCRTADLVPNVKHVPYVGGIDKITVDGARTYDNNNKLAVLVVQYAEKAWRDLESPWGTLPIFFHQHYLKLWQLSHPKLPVDVVLFDEAQDANPVMAAVVADQTHAQRIYVGDEHQAIMEFTGAVNAIHDMIASGMAVAKLTKSFRFGPKIASEANVVLDELHADFHIEGFEKIDSTVGEIDGEPNAILTRTNACAIDCLLSAQERGVSAFLVGGGTEVARFARAAQELNERGFTTHPDLLAFTSWGQVKAFVQEDEGADLKLMVDLVDRYGIATILSAIDDMPRAEDADLIISTAHKAKGREWDRVQIASDFVRQNKEGDVEPPSASELRLRYVAVTRAKLHLDATALEERDDEQQQ